MMPQVVPRSWKDDFALAAAMRQEDILYREKIARADALARERTEEVRVRQKRREQEAAAIEAALAPPERVAAFRVQIDRYDTKTVEALMDNREAMDAVRERIAQMLAKGHVLPDGRRVFKTMDGQKVFDEHGKELAAEVIDPQAIDDRKPRWETLRDARTEFDQLAAERQGLHDYQTRLDAVREYVDKDDLTERDLDRMKDDLAATMPDRVRHKLPADDPAAAKTRANATPPDLDSLVVRTGLAPAAPGPG